MVQSRSFKVVLKERILVLKTLKNRALLVLTPIFIMQTSAFADIKWDLDGELSSGYNDNINYATTNPIGDMVTHATVDGGLTQEGKNETFDLKTALTENIYTDHSSLDNLAESLNADYKTDLTDFEHVQAQ